MGDPSKSAETLFPMETVFPQIPDEAFNLFHSIDRELYARLVHNLRRDPAESVEVIGFWMWLERETTNLKLVFRLLSVPPPFLNDLADETASCLKFIADQNYDNNNYSHYNNNNNLGDGNKFEIPLLREFLGNPAVALPLFHQNRVSVLQGVASVVNTVCARAFADIIPPPRGGGAGGGYQVAAPVHGPVVYHPHPNAPPFVPGGGLVQVASPVAAGGMGFSMHGVAPPPPPPPPGSFPPQAGRRRKEVLGGGGEESRKFAAGEVPVDDRTIFLTFSKGYPISQEEVKEFFSRKFGDFIEDLIMQDVGGEEQVLYARMVARVDAMGVVQEIVGGNNKAKYSINGKHVWARKYVKKQHLQQLRESSTGAGTGTGDSSSA
ncbi:uncharacterized protein LOC127241244 [Andrographis paniculata]|uniref:uncharacterized protein LOC127241244 n=1 Tax=Andrographis paniculata TaxID=175694 RepID=UPI0021E89F32|nr:uncharacterized protein LOC127241244 [Andrographis paniculata]